MVRSEVTTDTFNRASLGSDWAQLNNVSGGDVSISGSTVFTGANDGDAAAARYVGGASFGDDQYASAVFVETDFGVNTHGIGVIARASSGTDAARDYYYFLGRADDTYVLAKIINGSTTVLSTAALTWNDGDRVEIECEVSTIRGMRNSSTVATVQDSSLTTGLPGIIAAGSGAAATGDNWAAGDLVNPSAILTGSAVSTISESDIVAGGKTIIATLSGDTYVPAVSTTAITHVTTTTISSLTTFTTSFIIALPSTAANDLMLLEYTHRSTNTGGIFGTGGSGTSWTLKHSRTYGPSSTFSAHLYYRRANDNHSSQSVSVSSLVNSVAAHVIVYRGAIVTGDPVSTATVVGEWNTSGNEAQAGISTNAANAMVCLVVANSPDLAVATQSSIMIGPLTERADTLATAGTDASIAHASAIWTGTGDTSTFSWSQTNASSGSFAYAITPVTSAPFDSARQAFIDGFDSAQSEATGWDAEVKAKAAVTEVVRTSDTVVTWTIGAQAAYNITAQETITGTIPGSILISGNPIVATPTFTIDSGGGAPVVIRIFYPAQMEGVGVGGVLGGNRMN